MGRSALTVGISTYGYHGLKNLEAPARDAEAIAQQLESSFPPFQVERLPGVKDKANDGLKTGKTSQVTTRQLQEALVRYFKPRGTTYSDTVLFYFSGHGLYDHLEGRSYLATSDTNPEDNKWGYDLTYLSALLRDSPVKRQIIWLDCCHSGGLIAVKDANPGEQSGYSRCFVAASQEIESAYELTSGSYSVLTDGLLQGLNPERVPGQWIDTLSLCAFVNQYLKNVRKTYPQRSLFLNVGEPIDLTYIKAGSTSLEGLNELQVDVCPYRALNAFDFTPEDVKVFFGRTALTDELLAQIYEHNFLAVLGPSGSGKSSVVRAGLLNELQQGKRRSGTETWHILPIIRPGESPLRNLAGVFIPEILRTKKQGEALLSSFLADLKAQGAAALVDLIKEDDEQPIVLVVDQFEEIFTLCRGSQEKEQERRDFLDCLFEAVDTLAGQLRLVVTLRADFLGKCLEQSYGNLAGRIKNCRVDITPLTDSELDEVINKPAATVGLQVAPYLQDRLREHIKEAPGSLPLLEYALTELWRDWHTRYTSEDTDFDNQLTFEGYDRIGGVAGALEKQANAVYESFAESTVKQGLVQRIFVELVQPGEETEDTRRQVLKRELISEIHPESMLDEVLGKLVEARLVVTDEVPTENDPNAVVIELAHEATIRHWQQLRYWLNKHRQDLPVIRQLRDDTVTWQINNQQSKYLLVGARLDAALKCVEKYQQLGYVRQNVQTFVQVSYETWIAEEKERERQILEAMHMLAEVQWSRYQQLDSLLTITRAAERVRWLREKRPEILPDNASKIAPKLQETLYDRIQETQRLEGHKGEVSAVVYSPNGKTLASGSEDHTVKLWNVENGSLLFTLEGHSDEITTLVYSPNGKTLASAGRDHTVKLWNVENGSLLFTLKSHSKWVTTLVYSPNGKTLASASRDDTAKLWDTATGSLIITFSHNSNSDSLKTVAYSPDGSTIAFTSWDDTAKLSILSLWAADGSLPVTLDTHTKQIDTMVYSPDGKTFASASWDVFTVKLWNLTDKNLITTLDGHSDRLRALVYSPDGKIIASVSDDKTVKLWNVADGSLLTTLVDHSDRSKFLICNIIYSPDGKTLLTHDGSTVKLWNIADGSLITTLGDKDYSDGISTVVYSPDGKTLASAGSILSTSGDYTVKLWSAENGRLVTTLNHSGMVKALAFSPDGTTLASASHNHKVTLWNITDKTLTTLKIRISTEGLVLDYSPNGTTLASSDFEGTVLPNGTVTEKGTLKLWNPADGNLIYALEGHSGNVRTVVYSPDGATLASASNDETVKLWNPEDGSLLATFKGHRGKVGVIAYGPDGKTLASGSEDRTVKLWNVENGSLLFTLQGHSHDIIAVAYSPNGKTLASVSYDKTAKLWNALEGSLICTLGGHNDEVKAVVYSPDGTILVSASDDSTVKLWNAADGSLLTTCRGHRRAVITLAYSPDGTTFASASYGDTIKLWNAADGNLLATLDGHTFTIVALAYSPDGTTLASASYDQTVKLWNTADGSLLTTLKGHSKAVQTLAYSPDGTILASASDDSTVKLWNVCREGLDLDSLLSTSCNWLAGYLRHNPNVDASDKKLLERCSESKFK